MSSTKLKLLYLMQLLEEKSDEEHPVSADDILLHLKNVGIECERKSVYSDIAALRSFGMDILRVKAPKNGYVLVSRCFELAELRLLIDAVQAAGFITPKKTKGLIEKIGTLCSDDQFKRLKRQVYIESRVKCKNEEIYYNIDLINRAIEAGTQVRFLYSRRKISDSLNSQKEERQFLVNPYAMLWSNDHYYLVCNNPKYQNLMHVRIDRMRKVEILPTKARSYSEVSEYKTGFDTADYAAKLYNMYSGETETVELLCSLEVLEQILDRFGEKVPIKKAADGTGFYIKTKASISHGLVSWLMQFGDDVRVVSPESLKDAVVERAQRIVESYGHSGT